MSNTELRTYRYITGQHKKNYEMSNTELRTKRCITGKQKNYRNEQHGTQNIKTHNRSTQKKKKEISNTEHKT
jgi:hypothetical protein